MKRLSPWIYGYFVFMKILISFEESQAVTKEFRKLGLEAFSCDLQSCSGGHPEWHKQGDIFELFREIKDALKFIGLHPVCRYLTNAGVRWIASKKPILGYDWSDKYQIYINWERFAKMEEAALIFKNCLIKLKSVGCGYVENPIMHKYAMEIIRQKPSQIIQPYQFGHLEKKATCLWIEGLPKLKETNNVYDEMMKLPYRERAKVHYASPRNDRDKLRSKTYAGIAKAMAEQWNNYLKL